MADLEKEFDQWHEDAWRDSPMDCPLSWIDGGQTRATVLLDGEEVDIACEVSSNSRMIARSIWAARGSSLCAGQGDILVLNESTKASAGHAGQCSDSAQCHR